MTIRKIALNSLLVNRANDRHGELENETAAIAWLFNTHESHMRSLAKDIVEQGEIFELPLVWPDGSSFIVFDGNRRVTCLKLLDAPRRAPTRDLQKFFEAQREHWRGAFPEGVQCQVEADRDRIDGILFRRHTGTQSGVGQSKWTDRMKANFVNRTGKGDGFNVADEIEKRLSKANLLPTRRKIPRSTMNRLLSAEPFRNRLGFSVNKGRFAFTHSEDVVLSAMARVAQDLANRDLVLGDIWDVDGKRAYLDKLELQGVLPNVEHTLSTPRADEHEGKPARVKPSVRAKPTDRPTLIPMKDFGLIWPGRLQRHHQIWEELQFHLELKRHPNSISVLLRVLLELAIENYITRESVTVHENDKLSTRLLKVGKNLQTAGKIGDKEMGILNKFQQNEKLVSADTLNRYVHLCEFRAVAGASGFHMG
jgi:hypothetical protein